MVFLSGGESVQGFLPLYNICIAVGHPVIREEGWDPVIREEGLPSYQRGGLIQLSERRVDPVIREEGWDPVIREEGWDPVIREKG